jgi:hypothetical protein
MLTEEKYELHQFDYKRSDNLIRYGSERPPAFDLKGIQHDKIYLFVGTADKLSTVDNVRVLAQHLGSRVKHHREYENVSHSSFVVGNNNLFLEDAVTLMQS